MAEASAFTGVEPGYIRHAIDGRELRRSADNKLSFADLVALLITHHAPLAPGARKLIVDAVHDHEPRVALGAFVHLQVDIDAASQQLRRKVDAFQRWRRQRVEERADVLGGEPVIKGTRLPVRHIAAAPAHELLQDRPDVTPEDVAMAAVFRAAYPRRGRPPG